MLDVHEVTGSIPVTSTNRKLYGCRCYAGGLFIFVKIGWIMMAKALRTKFSYARILAFMLLSVIVTGTLLLMTPLASRDYTITPLIDCLFTSTSATCVTGLTVFDTFSHWSTFGQMVIISLIQIGGLGFMTVISMLFVFIRKQITLREKMLFVKSSGDGDVTDTVDLVKKIFLGTLFFELLGALILFFRFYPHVGLKNGIYYSVFHSISAFCNAGFDIMGKDTPSLTSCVGDFTVNFAIMLLIVMGGLGFLVWGDILHSKFVFKKFKLHTKIVMISTFILIITGAVLFYFLEKKHAFAGLSHKEQILASFFESVTLRTAGFFSVDQAKLSESGALVAMSLMFIGGSPGSTAGGIKTTTFVILLIDILHCARNKKSINIARKKISNEIVNQASAIASIYLLSVILSVIVICAIEPFSMKEVAFEVVSAIGTVGVSMGITPSLTSLSKVILVFLMFAGRMGGLTLALVMAESNKKVPLDRPTERVMIG